jgi:elongation factor Ts
MEITAQMVKELRECTGAGMMDCKKALTESAGDVDAAVDLLRTKGLAALAKKAGRATNEGVIGGYVSDDRRVGALVEVNCETDFVARNDGFKAFVGSLATHVGVAAPADLPGLLGQQFTGREHTVEQVLGETVGKLGENMGIARFSRYELSAKAGLIVVYIHGVGNIGVMVEIAAGSAEAAQSEVCATVARDVAMQIAATAPLSIGRDNVPADVIEHELTIYKAQAAESGKPEPIQQKMAEGRLEKFFKEVTLLEQPFVKDADMTVRAYLDGAAKQLGTTLEIARFERMVLGETADAAQA